MKGIALACLSAIVVTGCIVHSVQPFCTERSKVKLPQLDGEWDLLTSFGDNVAEKHFKPWVFTNDTLTAWDEAGSRGQINVTYFKVGSRLYCDSIAGDAEDKSVNWYWIWHVRPMHTVSQVEMKDDTVKFRPLDLDWFTNIVARRIYKLPQIDQSDAKWPICTATPQQWEKFLTRYGGDTNAFPDAHIFVLKRRQGGKP